MCILACPGVITRMPTKFKLYSSVRKRATRVVKSNKFYVYSTQQNITGETASAATPAVSQQRIHL